jgi:hypothetical protein
MNFIENYKWPVPVAFKDSLQNRKLQAGDVFYDSPSAYEKPWGVALMDLHHVVTIRTASSLTVTLTVCPVLGGVLQPSHVVTLPFESFIEVLKTGIGL